jgi:hypothetical protein
MSDALRNSTVTELGNGQNRKEQNRVDMGLPSWQLCRYKLWPIMFLTVQVLDMVPTHTKANLIPFTSSSPNTVTHGTYG